MKAGFGGEPIPEVIPPQQSSIAAAGPNQSGLNAESTILAKNGFALDLSLFEALPPPVPVRHARAYVAPELGAVVRHTQVTELVD